MACTFLLADQQTYCGVSALITCVCKHVGIVVVVLHFACMRAHDMGVP